MTAAWMLYCVACACVFAVAALLAERSLVLGRTPVRLVWVAAITLSCVVPAIAFRNASHPTVIVPAAVPTHELAPDSLVGDPTSTQITAPSVVAPTFNRGWTWSAAKNTISRANRPLAIAWGAASTALALYLAFGFVALARLRKRCYPRDVLGVRVLVSDRTGPAIVGVLDPAIVMPEWALTMQTSQLALMLEHEQEHRRAHDVPLLAVAQLALIAMPWNVALWWALVRLGLAIELDCDARVLRNADPRSYGDLLLEVARPRQGLPLLGATAFAERARGLELRIRSIAARRSSGTHRARVIAAAVCAAALTVAWTTPRPVGAPHLEFSQPQRGLPHLSMPPVAAISTSNAVTRSKTLPIVVDPREIPPAAGTRGQDSLSRVSSPDVTSNASKQAVALISDSAFSRLFAGLTLSPDREAAARGILAALEERQLEQVVAVNQAVGRVLPLFAAAAQERNAAFRALLTNDADRATFDANIAKNNVGPSGRSGGRARSGGGGAPAEDLGGGRSARGSLDPLATGRARGGALPPRRILTSTPTFDLGNVDDELRSIFNGIALTPELDAEAHKIDNDTRREMLPLLPDSPPDQLVLLPNGSVLLRPEAKAALMSLLESDADRATLDARISIDTRIVVRNPPPGVL
jgi:beta-lactamase regulating signal transducer with metallopeptidase domain